MLTNQPHKNLAIGTSGQLYNVTTDIVIRPNYCRTHRQINSIADVKASLRAGSVAWPGGYPLYFITQDGSELSFESVREEFGCIVDGFRYDDSQWKIIGVAVNYENDELFCAHSGEKIESAYGE